VTARRALALAIGMLSLAVGLSALSLVQAPAAVAANPLEQASLAAQRVPFSGRLRLEWRDDNGDHSTEVNVHSSAGELQIQGPSELVATPTQRYVVSSDGWDLLSPGDPTSLGPIPPLTRKYHVAEGSGPVMFGRPTIEIALGDVQRPAARLYLDRATKLLLRREEFDSMGEPVRSLYFVSLSLGTPAAIPRPSHTVDERGRRIGANSLPAPYMDPARLAQGYQRVAVFETLGGIQVVYSDGLHSLSVFERMGSMDTRSMAAAGEPATVGPWSATRYVWAGGQVVVWRARGATFAVVADAPAGEVLAALNQMPATRGGSPWQRLRHACRRLDQAVSGYW
jgi:hypothetical protein